MIPDSTATKIIDLTLDYSKPSIYVETNWWVFLTLALLVLLGIYLFKRFLKNNYSFTDIEIEISGSPKATFRVRRDEETLYIANRIYIELITRKAAIPISEEDVISEVYDSWYELFQTIRKEIKSVPGEYLRNHDSTSALIGLTVKILNEGLRPHLTNYQAEFRKWYNAELKKDENESLTPQEIQKKFPKFDQLYDDMKKVNKTLLDYSNELEKLIKGE